MNKVYVFGLQRSGTNFFKTLLTDNFDIEIANRPGTWWHYTCPPYSNLAEHDAYVVYKNPYQWVESICYRSAADIIPTNIATYDLEAADGYMINKINVERLCRLYQDHVLNWNNSRFNLIQYESLLTNDGRNKILSSFPYNKKTLQNWSIPDKVFMSTNFNNLKQDYYINGNLTHLKRNEVEIINSMLCDKIFTLTGYSRL